MRFESAVTTKNPSHNQLQHKLKPHQDVSCFDLIGDEMCKPTKQQSNLTPREHNKRVHTLSNEHSPTGAELVGGVDWLVATRTNLVSWAWAHKADLRKWGSEARGGPRCRFAREAKSGMLSGTFNDCSTPQGNRGTEARFWHPILQPS